MGWNRGFEIFERTVIDTYNAGKLDKEMLEILGKPYIGTDIDSGGWNELAANDGKDVIEITVTTWRGKLEIENENDPEYMDSLWDEFSEITGRDGWGWC